MNDQRAHVHIVGIGSPAGDDRLGWIAVEHLRNSPVILSFGKDVTLLAIDRPGARILAEFTAGQHVILIDAVRSGASPGTLYSIDSREGLAMLGGVSTHGFGVADSLALAETLGCLPERWVVFGLEAGAITEEASGLSVAVERALSALIKAVEREIQTSLVSERTD